ncbi:MAG: hypothetical protein PW843_25050 [Azospirillaceae bacterium]|nr:hypothetical protein [Azospirillaceae bacterium]
MTQVFKPLFGLVRRVPAWVDLIAFLILGTILWFTMDFRTMVFLLVWLGLRQGDEEKWLKMWTAFGLAAMLAVMAALGYPGH